MPRLPPRGSGRGCRSLLEAGLLAVAVAGCVPQASAPDEVSSSSAVAKPVADGPVAREPPPLMTIEEQLQALSAAVEDSREVPAIGKSDLLNVSVYDEPDLTVNGIPVRPDGRISFPLVGDVQAEGLTVDELADSLNEKLREFVLTPRVSVIVQAFNSLSYTVYGEVVRPGVYPLHTDVSITDAIAKAGGLNKGQFRATSVELADLTHAFIARKGKPLPVNFSRLLREGDLRFNLLLQSGDLINIPSGLAQEVYVVGEVNKTALFAFREGMPMSRTLAQAEGFTRDADLSRIHVVRGTLSNPVLIVSDFTRVLAGEAQDVRLRPGDIIYVPPTNMSNWAYMINQIVPALSLLQTGIILTNTNNNN